MVKKKRGEKNEIEKERGKRKKERLGGGGRETFGLNTLIFNPDKMSV